MFQWPSDVLVQVVTVGSKDVGFVELASSEFPAKILDSLTALATQLQRSASQLTAPQATLRTPEISHEAITAR